MRIMIPKADTGDSADELVTSIQLSPIAAVVTDPNQPDNPIIAVNQAFVDLTGYAADEAIGRNCRFLAGKRTESEGSAALRDAIAARKPGFAELLNYRRDGTAFRNAVMIAPVFDVDGRLTHFLGSQMDVTDGRGTPSVTRRREAAEKVATLSTRQREVLREMVLGYRNKQIAPRLGISEKTVKMHRASMLAKLGVASSADAVRIAVEAGL
jgi:PAS domain S-box-containing protein